MGIRARLLYRIVCDVCGEQGSPESGLCEEARLIAQQLGFVQHFGQILCPSCVQQFNEMKNGAQQ